MKIKVSELRKVIKEEVARILEAWGDLTTSEDSGLVKIKNALRGMSTTPPKITKTMDEMPTYWFSIINIPEGDVQWIASELFDSGARIKIEQGRMIVTVPPEKSLDPNAHLLHTRHPAGDSVWEENEAGVEESEEAVETDEEK
jgi:hypothetical protein